MSTATVPVDQIGPSGRDMVLNPDPASCAAIAQRLHLPGIRALTCRFTLTHTGADTVRALGRLQAVVIQADVATLDLFECTLDDSFTLRFVPEHLLSDTLDPDDPVDEVGYTGARLDLDEAMIQQLALALDPYPRAG